MKGVCTVIAELLKLRWEYHGCYVTDIQDNPE